MAGGAEASRKEASLWFHGMRWPRGIGVWCLKLDGQKVSFFEIDGLDGRRMSVLFFILFLSRR